MALPASQVMELIQRAREQHDPRAREALLAAYAPLVKSIALRFLGSGETVEDLMQEGNLGLLSAIDLFNPNHNIQFSTYAHHLIAGQIRHYLRDRGTLIRQPAWIQEERARLEKTKSLMSDRLGREPTPQELGDETNLSEGRLQEILATQRMSHVMRLDTSLPEESADAIDEERLQEAAPEPALTTEDRLALQEALGKLRQVERRVVEDFYFGELSQTEIARRLGVSSNYVSRILKTTTQKLQEFLSDQKAPPTRATKRLEQKLRAPDTDSVIDEPTGMYTPGYFKDRLEEELLRARRYGHSVAVMRVLVDGIPDVARADIIQRSLQAASHAIRQTIRRIDIAARLDKREFGVVLPFTGETAHMAGKRVLAALDENEAGLPLQGRVGVAFFPEQAVTASGLMSAADPQAESAIIA